MMVQIDLSILRDNAKEVVRLLGKTSLMAVVKANAYGHGLLESTLAFIEAGVNYVAVNSVEEGKLLREHNIQIPILVLRNTPVHELDEGIQLDLTLSVYSYAYAKIISVKALQLGKTVPIHIKVNTGMGRYGMDIGQCTADEVLQICRLPYVNAEGIYSHYRNAFTFSDDFPIQDEIFNELIDALESRGIYFKYIHIANSAGILHSLGVHHSMARAGMLLYGIVPKELQTGEVSVNPAMSVKSEIIMIRNIRKNQALGYGTEYISDADKRIAVIDIGFADGYPRSLSNKGKVLIKSCFANVIGTVCMNNIIVDISHINSAALGDEVIILGEQMGKRIDASDLSLLANTIETDILCGFGNRLPVSSKIFTSPEVYIVGEG